MNWVLCRMPEWDREKSTTELARYKSHTLDLTEDEARALVRHLGEAIDYARYPFAPRLDPLKAILASSNRRYG